MPTKKKAPAKQPAAKKQQQVPALFRINVEVGDVTQAARDWGALLGLDGRPQAGSRVYFTAGAVSGGARDERPARARARARVARGDADASARR